MHLAPDANILSIFHWCLRSLFGSGLTSPTSAEPFDIASQGAGSGSCGIAAVNFVETDLDTDVGRWNTSTSPFFPNRALRDLVVIAST